MTSGILFRHSLTGRLSKSAGRIFALCMVFSVAMTGSRVFAQVQHKGITINGSVYGGGMKGQIYTANDDNARTAATVTVNHGVMENVYGGGEEGLTKGGAAVVLKGGTISGSVFGGARMADVNGSVSIVIDAAHSTDNLQVNGAVYGGNDISGSIAGSASVAATAQRSEDTHSFYIKDLFGGGNGDYDYTSEDGIAYGKSRPDLARTSINLQSGRYDRVFGGGNSATVTESTTITLNNSSSVGSGYQFGSVFGGNNLVEMNIRPAWNLEKASIRNLYSGGNKGSMTYSNGLILELLSPDLTVENVFGGCRIADVHPSQALAETLRQGQAGEFTFPAGFGARVRVADGKIRNVYGGNDIAGDVYYGTNVIIESDIIGDVYGGGNGSYVYTISDPDDDCYLNPNGKSGVELVRELNKFRPNSQNAMIQITGKSSENPTYIGGSVYCGGNSATLRSLEGNTNDAFAELRLGSYVIANNVFLGSNGANMVGDEVFSFIKSLNVFDLTNHDVMEEYMKGVEVSIKPRVTIMDGFVPQSSYIGSFFCGGNVGSMTASGTFDIGFLNSIVIFDKLVAGCNNANVPYSENNAFHQGGLTAATENGVKVSLNISGLKMEPRKLEYVGDSFVFDWNMYDGDYEGFLKGGNIYGGCYESGIINGGVNINIEDNLITSDTYKYFTEHAEEGLGWDEHCFEPFVSTLTVFGGGYGSETEIWGDARVNLTKTARLLKVRGGGEMGWIGKMNRDASGVLTAGQRFVTYDAKNQQIAAGLERARVDVAYNTFVSLNALPINADGNAILGDDMTGLVNNVGEICAGGQEGVVTGNTTLYLDGGSTYCAFGGASNSDIYGGTEVFIGKNGYPYVTETVYGGNDFGGQIMGTIIHNTGNSIDGSIKKVKSNTYVEYNRGEIGYEVGKSVQADEIHAVDYGIFAGSFGKYDYNASMYTDASGGAKYSTLPVLMSHIELTDADKNAGVDYASNTFLNISSQSTDVKDKIFRAYGGSEGQAGWEGVATTYSTYVLLNARNADERGADNYLTAAVYGGGDCSKTYETRLDLYGIHAQEVFAGCRGMSNERRSDIIDEKTSEADKAAVAGISYMSELSTLNVYPTLNNLALDVYGAGAYSGSKQTKVNLLGGRLHDVYGASINEGVTYLSHVSVPSGSTAQVNAIYGGGKGESEKNACDTYLAIVDYNTTQSDAYVNEAIYGGNNQYRFTQDSYVNVTVPVRTSEPDVFADIYGAGHGQHTLGSKTVVSMASGAKARYVYGGGRDGKVYNIPSLKAYLDENDIYGNKYPDAVEQAGFAAWTLLSNEWKKASTNGWDSSVKYGDVDLTAMLPLTTATDNNFSTQVFLNSGSEVTMDVYGGGLGEKATVAGQTDVQMLGASVLGNIYGGGRGGNVANEMDLDGGSITVQTNVNLQGGTVTNVYGGGYEGSVGLMTETLSGGKVTVRSFSEGNSFVTVGNKYGQTHTLENGLPAIARSLYGGGEKGAVLGTSNVIFNNGYVGYIYKGGKYVENIDYEKEGDKFLIQNGNVFGGGYGEGASTLHSKVTVWDGTIRNGLYGGGEIASVGFGNTVESTESKERVLDRDNAVTYGSSEVTMYRGTVYGDVFGGGRGYSYDVAGNEVIGSSVYTDGYVFGTTSVYLYGGVIGTADNIDDDHGNVFGGGNVGFVYSEGLKSEEDGYYYKNGKLTEDAKVVVSPYAQVKSAVSFNGKSYSQYDFVPTEEMNGLLKANTDVWDKLDYEYGVTVHNGVFAGGNVSRGSDKLFANTRTVYGNATASLVDVYNRDLITVGNEKIGGLYGDGNLTKVDGYRELSIRNFGTDYYNLASDITMESYNALNDRERAYFEPKYKCLADYTSEHGSFKKDQSISLDEWRSFPVEEQAHWTQAAFCSIYAGRLLNTIQRADFVGVFGSRIVLQGAQDRAVDQVDYTDYAINRVGELSLNRVTSAIAAEEENNRVHGNYFGMYNIVHYLEAMTSDVDFTDKRTTSNTKYDENGVLEDRSYYDYKLKHITDKYRNNGTSANEVALAKGVYLELVEEPESEDASEEKQYGPITGVIELDLMDTQTDLGGAYVYAKNYHGTRTGTMQTQAILSSYNAGAKTNKGYSYLSDNLGMQTSGNFVNAIKQIYDDCYPNNGDVSSPAHYWFLRGTVYVYDQYISAYTGSSTAYKADVQIPLTISSGSNGKLKVTDVQPNLFAFYKDANSSSKQRLGKNDEKLVNGVTYHQNDVITYWDWSQLPADEKMLFVRETYVAIEDFKLTENAENTYQKKDALLPEDLVDPETGAMRTQLWSVSGKKMVPAADVVRLSNTMNHTKGYALTADITNPMQWNDRYVIQDESNIDESKGLKKFLNNEEYQQFRSDVEKSSMTDAEKQKELSKYIEGPSYYTTVSGVYGQKSYNVNDVVTGDIQMHYVQEILGKDEVRETLSGDQAEMEKAYISIQAISYEFGGHQKNLQEGVAIPESEFNSLDEQTRKSFQEAWVCTSTIDAATDYVISGEIISNSKYESIIKNDNTAAGCFSKAYLCTSAGLYGGTFFEKGHNYNTLSGWCSLTPSDREHFNFNYDAFDIFIRDLDPSATVSQYDKPGTYYYSAQLDIEYEASLKATAADDHIGADGNLTYTNADGEVQTVEKDKPIRRSEFEKIPNEKSHYIAFDVVKSANGSASETVDMYFILQEFTRGEHTYLPGSQTDVDTYNALDASEKAKVGKYTFTRSQDDTKTYYFCNKSYKVNEKGEGCAASALNAADGTVGSSSVTTYSSGQDVPVGTVISEDNYAELPNLQYLFDISGKSPIETSTLYVSRDADIKDVQQDRVVTVVYQYQYDESSNDGSEVEQVTERHVVNIHVTFKTGVPKIGELRMPGVVFPGTTIGLRQPTVSEGAYEIIGGGWEIFRNEDDAVNHVNGTDYVNNQTPMYYYQDGYWAAYYTKTYLGKTYSNPVRLTVANHHRMEDVMTSTHTDYDDDGVTVLQDNVHDYLYLNKAIEMMNVDPSKRAPKIYIDGHECDGDDVSELDYLYDFYKVGQDEPDNIYLKDVRGGNNLVFFLQGDVEPVKYKDNWTSIGTEELPFVADLHGDGHYISGLTSSLFDYFNGNVWNLGVKGSFTGSGIADHASANGRKTVNCWAWTTSEFGPDVTPVRSGEVTRTNCYYLAAKKASKENGVTETTLSAMLNGELAYKLNEYYLTKRYQDQQETGSGTSDQYSYWREDNSGTLKLRTGYYGKNPDKYVEERYADNDFLYANGQNPTSTDIRFSAGKYYPVYPDDYIFFGQKLSYDILTGDIRHDMNPDAVVRNTTTNNRLVSDESLSNRVYRAMAYYGDKTPQTVYFNRTAAFADEYKESEDAEKHVTHKGMTALDLTGYNDSKKYTDKKDGFQPIMDYDGLASITTSGITANLLVYANPQTDKSYSKIESSLVEPALIENDRYGTIQTAEFMPRGHLVDLTGNGYVATHSHFLVDAQDFDCPISYKFNNDNVMWYQRTPKLYTQINDESGVTGWETVCLPFTVETVTTQQKGTLTHFYADDEGNHEYWLRGFGNATGDDDETVAEFLTPTATADEDGYDSRYVKTSSYQVASTFLWDYYYSKNEGAIPGDDSNGDSYQQYYSSSRSYSNYPYLTALVPYVISFPGDLFYEFDLSGSFQPLHTNVPVAKLNRQVVTFKSGKLQTIAVTADAVRSTSPEDAGLEFCGVFSRRTLDEDCYLPDETGDKFVRVEDEDDDDEETVVTPFRAYLRDTAGTRGNVIYFGDGSHDDDRTGFLSGGIEIAARNMIIYVTNHTDDVAEVEVFSSTGSHVTTLSLQPGETDSTGILSVGIYVVGHTKVLVK